MRRVLRHLVQGGLVAALLVGCQVRTTVLVEMEEDGSGTVTVGVGLDAEAMAEVPDLDRNGTVDAADLTQMVRVDDLRSTGWEVGGPEGRDDGLTWLEATKPFGTPEEAEAILTELTGPEGPLRDWDVQRERSFGQTTYSVSGTADLNGGLEAFGDAGLAAALDGEPLGEDVVAIEQRYGRPVSEMVTLDLSVSLPGQASEDSWQPVLGGASVEIASESTELDRGVWALVGVAALCALALVILLFVRLIRSRRAA